MTFLSSISLLRSRVGLVRHWLREALRLADVRLRWRNRAIRRRRRERWPIPPLRLILLVSGTADVHWFLESGRLAAGTIRDVLGANGVEFDELRAVLDFGCGCGRVTRYWPTTYGPALHGCDTNPRLIAWCREHLPFARFVTNAPRPPLPYTDETFDLVYALSVFTHLHEDQQHAWLAELRRVIRPGGYLLVTTQGRYYLDQMRQNERRRFLAGEIVVRQDAASGSNRCAVFHPREYIERHFTRGFTMVDFVSEGAAGNPFQDVVLLRKKATAECRVKRMPFASW